MNAHFYGNREDYHVWFYETADGIATLWARNKKEAYKLVSEEVGAENIIGIWM